MSSFKKGGMYILSSPSGAGKTTLVKKISKNKNFIISISHTTRPPRQNEKNGRDYFFISKNNFKKLIKKQEFIEHAKVFDNYYGSAKNVVTSKLRQGKNIIFDIDWQGTKKLSKFKNLKLNNWSYSKTCRIFLKGEFKSKIPNTIWNWEINAST